MTRQLELSVPSSDLWEREKDQRLSRSTVASDSISPDCDGDSINPGDRVQGAWRHP